MNIQDIIGPVDVFSAAVALGVGAGVTIISVTALARQPRKKMEYEFQLADMKQKQAHAEALQKIDVERETSLGKIAANKQVEVSRIESGMVDVKKVDSTQQNHDY